MLRILVQIYPSLKPHKMTNNLYTAFVYITTEALESKPVMIGAEKTLSEAKELLTNKYLDRLIDVYPLPTWRMK